MYNYISTVFTVCAVSYVQYMLHYTLAHNISIEILYFNLTVYCIYLTAVTASYSAYKYSLTIKL